MEGRTIARPDSVRMVEADERTTPSMEGRTIARPDAGPAEGDGTPDRVPSMEGRTIARPDRAAGGGRQLRGRPSMEGRTIARPDSFAAGRRARSRCLQWRAGQLPGQTHVFGSVPVAVADLQWRAGQLPGQTRMSGPRVWPDCALQWRAGQLPGQTRSPAAKPNSARTAFNGGPDNCPARPGAKVGRPSSSCRLQWRAGQLPGQTYRADPRRAVCCGPSMEGRTIARPDYFGIDDNPSLSAHLQWRAGQLPGQTLPSRSAHQCRNFLQWRAGQLPGQTRPPIVGDRPCRLPFNGGPDNCPARPAFIANPVDAVITHLQWRAGQLPGQTGQALDKTPAAVRLQWRAGQLPGQTGQRRVMVRPIAFLQWRAGQLPGQTSLTSTDTMSWICLQWRAGQLPGQTGSGCPHHRSTCPFNGGPDNCPARQPQSDERPSRTLAPSMEGRTIARPD